MRIVKAFILSILIICFSSFMIFATEGQIQNRSEQSVVNDKRGPNDPAELEAFLDGVLNIQLSSNHIAGACIAVVKDGEIFLAKGYGYADVEKRKPVVADKTLFRPGSVSKLITWTAVMQLVEQGKIDLNADINIYLKDFKIPDTYPEPITMTHLLTHTPGFEDISRIFARNIEDVEPLGEFLANNIPARIFPPGELTAYSNYGSALAGYIVQEVSGVPFDDYVEEYIFKPLNMQNSTFRQPLPDEIAENVSVGYTFKKGIYVAKDFELINGLTPAGSMSTTAVDMAKFMIAHLQSGVYEDKRILQEETAQKMHTRLFSHDPRINGNAHGFWEKNSNDVRILEHGGDLDLFHTLLILLPDHNIGLYLSYNSVGGGGTPRDELLKAFLDRYYPIPDVPEPHPAPGFRDRAQRFFGYYRINRVVTSTYEKPMAIFMNIKIDITNKDRLLISTLGRRLEWQFVEVEPLVFQYVGGQNKLIFKEDQEGNITHAFFSKYPEIACIKIKWHQTPLFHFTVAGFSVLLFLSSLIWPLRAIGRFICRIKKDNNTPWLARWLVGCVSVLYLLFLALLGSLVADPMEILTGVPILLKIALVLPIIAVILTVISLVFVYLAWKYKYWILCSRLHYTLIVITSIIFILFLNYWNLLGFYY